MIKSLAFLLVLIPVLCFAQTATMGPPALSTSDFSLSGAVSTNSAGTSQFVITPTITHGTDPILFCAPDDVGASLVNESLGFTFTAAWPGIAPRFICRSNFVGHSVTAPTMPYAPVLHQIAWDVAGGGSGPIAGAAGYHIYWSATSGGPYIKLTDSVPGNSTQTASFLINTSIDNYYIAKAYDSNGVEGPASNELKIAHL